MFAISIYSALPQKINKLFQLEELDKEETNSPDHEILHTC